MSKCDNCLIRQAYASGFDIHWMGEDDCPAECPVDLEYGETYNSPTYRLEQKGSVGISKVEVQYPIIDGKEEDDYWK